MTCRSRLAGILTLGALLVSNAGAVNGIALSTRHAGGCTLFGTGLAMFGDIIRHDIVNNAVVKDTVLYSGKAFYSMFRPDGKRFAFIKYNPSDK